MEQIPISWTNFRENFTTVICDLSAGELIVGAYSMSKNTILKIFDIQNNTE